MGAFAPNLAQLQGPPTKSPVPNFWWLFEGCGFYGGRKNAISHWQGYRTARDNFILPLFKHSECAIYNTRTSNIYVSRPTQVLLHTHVEWSWSVGVWPTDQSVSLASRSDCDTSSSRLRQASWTLDAQNSSTCQTGVDCGRHHRQIQLHSHRSPKTLSSALTLASPPADGSASIATLHRVVQKPNTFNSPCSSNR